MRAKLLAEFSIAAEAWDTPHKGKAAGARVQLAEGIEVERYEAESAGPSAVSSSTRRLPPTVAELRAAGVEVSATVDGSPADPVDGALGKAAALDRMASALMRELEEDDDSTPLEKARVMGQIAQVLGVIGRLTGDFDLGKRVLKLPMWVRIEGAIRKALVPYPDAARAVGDALMQLHEDREVTR